MKAEQEKVTAEQEKVTAAGKEANTKEEASKTANKKSEEFAEKLGEKLNKEFEFIDPKEALKAQIETLEGEKTTNNTSLAGVEKANQELEIANQELKILTEQQKLAAEQAAIDKLKNEADLLFIELQIIAGDKKLEVLTATQALQAAEIKLAEAEKAKALAQAKADVEVKELKVKEAAEAAEAAAALATSSTATSVEQADAAVKLSKAQEKLTKAQQNTILAEKKAVQETEVSNAQIALKTAQVALKTQELKIAAGTESQKTTQEAAVEKETRVLTATQALQTAKIEEAEAQKAKALAQAKADVEVKELKVKEAAEAAAAEAAAAEAAAAAERDGLAAVASTSGSISGDQAQADLKVAQAAVEFAKAQKKFIEAQQNTILKEKEAAQETKVSNAQIALKTAQVALETKKLEEVNAGTTSGTTTETEAVTKAEAKVNQAIEKKTKEVTQAKNAAQQKVQDASQYLNQLQKNINQAAEEAKYFIPVEEEAQAEELNNSTNIYLFKRSFEGFDKRVVGDKFNYSISNFDKDETKEKIKELKQIIFNQALKETNSKSSEICGNNTSTTLSRKDAAIIAIIAIKNGGIGNKEEQVKEDLWKVCPSRGEQEKQINEYFKLAAEFSKNFQEVAKSAGILTGNEQALEKGNLVGMRLKRLSPQDVIDIFQVDEELVKSVMKDLGVTTSDLMTNNKQQTANFFSLTQNNLSGLVLGSSQTFIDDDARSEASGNNTLPNTRARQPISSSQLGANNTRVNNGGRVVGGNNSRGNGSYSLAQYLLRDNGNGRAG